MPISSDFTRNLIAGISLVIVILGGAYSYIISEYEYRAERDNITARYCEQVDNNKLRLDELDRKVDGLTLIRAELSGLKSVMSSMDKRLERFENYFLEARQ
jgi:hypothetical protein